MPEKKTRGEDLANDYFNTLIMEPQKQGMAIFEALCNVGTQLERIADLGVEFSEVGLLVRGLVQEEETP